MQRAAPRARRYISEDFSGSALHPIDVLDAGSGRQLAQLVDANLVRALHQSLCQGQNGSRASKSLFLPKSREVLMLSVALSCIGSLAGPLHRAGPDPRLSPALKRAPGPGPEGACGAVTWGLSQTVSSTAQLGGGNARGRRRRRPSAP